MNKEQKAEITKHIYLINEMDMNELRKFAQKWHLAKTDLDEEVFNFVLRGVDIKMMELKEQTDMSPLIVMSELNGEDIGL